MIIDTTFLKDNLEVRLLLETHHSVLDEYPKGLPALWSAGTIQDDCGNTYSGLYSKLDVFLEHSDNTNYSICDGEGLVQSVTRVPPFTIILNVKLSKEHLDKFAFDEIIDGQNPQVTNLMLNNLTHSVVDELLQYVEIN